MSQNIKVNEKDKHLFDMFQAEFTLKAGKKITQQELFSRIMEFTRSKKDNFFGKIQTLPLSENDVKKIRALQDDWGVKTEESDIDSTIYGA
ncbi:MAG: hypothetical protein MIO93_13115 [ANME-2 cluster archaeon]|nr:hypothetical protein [ANME-2 cluster archaeon]